MVAKPPSAAATPRRLRCGAGVEGIRTSCGVESRVGRADPAARARVGAGV